MIYIYILIYGLLLCYGRFSGVCSTVYIPFFSLYEDPTFYPNDMYVHNALHKGVSYLYPLLNIFGKLPSNTYFIFVIYILVSLVHIYFIFKITELLFQDLKEYNVGLILLLLFLYDYPIFFAFSQLVSQHNFCHTTVAMPILAASLYYYLKNNISLSLFLVSIMAIPLNFKSSWIITFIIFIYILLNFKKFTRNQILLFCFFLLISASIMFYYKAKFGGTAFNFTQRLEFCNFAIKDGRGEGVILLNPLSYFLKFFLIFFGGIYCVRFLKIQAQRIKFYYIYTVSAAIFIFGIVYHSYLYKWLPIPYLFTMDFPRSMGYPIILSILLIGGSLVRQTKENRSILMKWISIFVLFGLAYFPNFKLKSIVVYIPCIFIAYFLVYLPKWVSQKMKLKPLTAWLFVTAVLFLLIRDCQIFVKSYKIKSPHAPLIVFGLERNYYDCQMWAKHNTPRDSVFVSLGFSENKLDWDNRFRGYSGRTSLFGPATLVISNSELWEEHKRREKFIDTLSELISKREDSKIKSLINNAPWRLDYIVLPRNFSLEYPKVYSNDSYICYFVKKERGNKE